MAGGATRPGYKLRRNDGLTVREKQVLDLLDQGLTPIEVTATLRLTKQRIYQLIHAVEKKTSRRLL